MEAREKIIGDLFSKVYSYDGAGRILFEAEEAGISFGDGGSGGAFAGVTCGGDGAFVFEALQCGVVDQ